MHLFIRSEDGRAGAEEAGRGTGLGAAIDPGLLNGPLSWTSEVRILSTKPGLGHLTPPPLTTQGTPDGHSADSTWFRGPSFLSIGRSAPSSFAIGRGPAAAPPSSALRWYSPPRLRQGGTVHCFAARGGVGKSRARRRDPSGMFPSGPPEADDADWPQAPGGSR